MGAEHKQYLYEQCVAMARGLTGESLVLPERRAVA